MINGRRVKELREEQGLSLAELAEKVWKNGGAITRQRIAQLEDGGQDTHVSKANALANALGVKVDEIIVHTVSV